MAGHERGTVDSMEPFRAVSKSENNEKIQSRPLPTLDQHQGSSLREYIKFLQKGQRLLQRRSKSTGRKYLPQKCFKYENLINKYIIASSDRSTKEDTPPNVYALKKFEISVYVTAIESFKVSKKYHSRYYFGAQAG